MRMMIDESGRMSSTFSCWSYNRTACSIKEECTEERTKCDRPTSAKRRNHCYVVWEDLPTGESSVTLKGCWKDNSNCYDKQTCDGEVRGSKNQTVLFCCCDGNLCNSKFTYTPPPTTTTQGHMKSGETPWTEILPFVLVPLVITFILISLGFFIYKRRKRNMFREIPTIDPVPVKATSPETMLRPIQLQEIIARGRYGTVWKANYMNDVIAVKVFPAEDKASWLSEKEIYELPHMNHDSILAYLGVEARIDAAREEYWLLCPYHYRGSLSNYLKNNRLSWMEVCRIAETMMNGLAYLHEEIHIGGPIGGVKPAVAHRDFKSKNVLLKHNLHACISDFGLAMVFYAGQSPGEVHSQVGTRRYMAPEVLEGAISFTRDAFLRIDMYACALVLWEALSRCSSIQKPECEYRLPFEEEAGQHPLIDHLQELVVHRKVRPAMPSSWRKYQGVNMLCETIEECWDHDAEARLSASCVLERLSRIKQAPFPL